MGGLVVTFFFYNIIAPAFLHSIPQNSLNMGVNSVDKALRSLGINTSSPIDWKYAFVQLAERHDQVIQHKDEELQHKDDQMRELNVLNFIRSHMESFSLQTDPFHYTIQGSNSTPLVTITRNDIPTEDVPSSFQGRLEADFKTAYVRWYRIIKNSDDSRIAALLTALKTEQLCEKKPLSERTIAKTLAVIWCSVCNDIHSLLDAAKGHLIYKDANEVANAFARFQEDGFYVDFVRIFFKATKFRDRLSIMDAKS